MEKYLHGFKLGVYSYYLITKNIMIIVITHAKKKNDVKIPEIIIKNMDNNNKEVYKIWNNQGVESALKFMTK